MFFLFFFFYFHIHRIANYSETYNGGRGVEKKWCVADVAGVSTAIFTNKAATDVADGRR